MKTTNKQSEGWIGVDLDGTIAYYDHWRGIMHIGYPIPMMVDRVLNWIEQGIEVRIVTARVGPQRIDVPEQIDQIRTAIQDWCELHLGVRLEVTNQKDFAMIELWDDRAIQVKTNTGMKAYVP